MYNTARTSIINPIAENTQLNLSYFSLISSLTYPLNSSLSTKVIQDSQNHMFSFQHTTTRISSCALRSTAWWYTSADQALSLRHTQWLFNKTRYLYPLNSSICAKVHCNASILTHNLSVSILWFAFFILYFSSRILWFIVFSILDNESLIELQLSWWCGS